MNEPFSQLVFWCAQQGTRSQGRPGLTYQKLLTQDISAIGSSAEPLEGQGSLAKIHQAAVIKLFTPTYFMIPLMH